MYSQVAVSAGAERDGVAAVDSAGGAPKYDVGIIEENKYTERRERSVSAERTTQLNWVHSVC
jgi:hypothetical protein